MNASTTPTTSAKMIEDEPIKSQQDTKLPIIDLRPQPLRQQAWDGWRPGPYGPPSAPSMERRIAEESALEMAAISGHGRQDGRARKIRPRRTVDLGGPMARWNLMRSLRTCADEHHFIRPCIDHLIEFLPPQAYKRNPSTSILTRYVHTSTNKVRCPINVVRFTPDSRRVLTGATSGEFTLWNALTFNFETILQAHDTAVRAIDWSKSGTWLVSGDNSGILKYFKPNMNNLQILEGHKDSVRDISFSPNDHRFVSCGDDGLIKVWGFEEGREERNLTGHGWDVKCVKWHPTKGLLCSGGKDSLVKFWDPRTGKCLTTLHGHKSSVQACTWNPNGHIVATGSRDQMIKVFDIRMMKELVSLRGHKKEVCSLAWHPVHHEILTSGGSDGMILYWCLPDSDPVDELEFAHDGCVWSLDFHPLGHTLVSGSNDHTTRFWSRGRPGIKIANDKFHIGKDRARELGIKDEEEQPEDFFVPGLGHQYHPTQNQLPQPPFTNQFLNSNLTHNSHTNVSSMSNNNGSGTIPIPSEFENGTGHPPPGFVPIGTGTALRFPGNQPQPSQMGPPKPVYEVPKPSSTTIPGFGRATGGDEMALPGLAGGGAIGWRRGPLLSQEAAMGRDLGTNLDRKKWKTNQGGSGGGGRNHRFDGGMGPNRGMSRWANNLFNEKVEDEVDGSNGLDEFGREIPQNR